LGLFFSTSSTAQVRPEIRERINALGEVVARELAAPSIFVVVQFDDGTVASLLGNVGNGLYGIEKGFESIEEFARIRQEVEAKADFVKLIQSGVETSVGTVLFADNHSRLYSIDTTLEGIQASDVTKLLIDVPVAVPLVVTGGRYIPDSELVILKLDLPDGREALVKSSYDATAKPGTFLNRIAGTLFTEIPTTTETTITNNPATPAQPEQDTPDTVYVLWGRDGDPVEVASDEGTYAQIIQYERANNQAGLMNLTLQRRSWPDSSGVVVEIIDRGPTTTRFLYTDGGFSGREGVVGNGIIVSCDEAYQLEGERMLRFGGPRTRLPAC
jgi:hypothetical protein